MMEIGKPYSESMDELIRQRDEARAEVKRLEAVLQEIFDIEGDQGPGRIAKEGLDKL